MVAPPDLADASIVRRVGRGRRAWRDALRRVAVLAGVRHPGVASPTAMVADRSGSIVATAPRLDGDDLAVVRRLRGGLTAGECVAVGIDVAEALAALHAAGLAHGDVSPRNVVVAGGRSILVDVVAGASMAERGTPGFAAPERAVHASPAGDVFSLGRVLEYLADEDARQRIAAWSAPLCAVEPSERPTAAEAVCALRACATPVAVSVPAASIADLVRARAVTPEEETLRSADGRAWRAWRRGRRWARVAIVASAIAGIVVALASSLPRDPGYRYRPTMPISADAIAADPANAAASLVERRVAAIAAGDADALLATTTPDGAARVSDEGLALRLDGGDVGYVALTVEIDSAELLVESGNDATVRVVYTTPPHRVVDAGRETAMPETSSVVDLDIVWDDGRWAIVASRPRP